MLKIKFLVFVLPLVLFGCLGGNTFHFYSPESDQSFTIITNNNIRYIINGYHNSVPGSNFVKLDLGKVDRNVGDQIVGCWNKENRKWMIAMDNVTILDNELDTNTYKFFDHFSTDSSGIPTLKDYVGKDCFSISLEYRSLNRIEGAIKRR